MGDITEELLKADPEEKKTEKPKTEKPKTKKDMCEQIAERMYYTMLSAMYDCDIETKYENVRAVNKALKKRIKSELTLDGW